MEKPCFPLSLLLFFTLETAAPTEFFLIFPPLVKTSASYSQCDDCKHMTLTESAERQSGNSINIIMENGCFSLTIFIIMQLTVHTDIDYDGGFFFLFQLQHSAVVRGAWRGTELSGRPEFIFTTRTAAFYLTVFSKGRREKSIGSR